MPDPAFSDDIRRTLNRTQAATFSLDLPNTKMHGMPAPLGTGFFVSGDGWFVTAAHVVTEDTNPARTRSDVNQGRLTKEGRPGQIPAECQHLEINHVNLKNDFALIKVDLQKNLDKAFLKGQKQFPFLDISARRLDEGEPVYAFGYPLPSAKVSKKSFGIVGTVGQCPRVTSAIVSSTFERSKMVMSSQDTQVYVLDKALNYGNSGGPIVATSTGKVHALCSRFQPVSIPQPHLGSLICKKYVVIPSLYGIVVSLANSEILRQFDSLGITYTNN